MKLLVRPVDLVRPLSAAVMSDDQEENCRLQLWMPAGTGHVSEQYIMHLQGPFNIT